MARIRGVANPKPGLRRPARTSGSVAAADDTTEVSPPPAEPGRATSFLERVHLRRRRELGLRDLGGFVYEEHRQGEDHATLRREKLDALEALDGELHTIEHALDDRQELLVLREPGIASCPHCSTIHGSDANFCPNCGAATAARAVTT